MKIYQVIALAALTAVSVTFTACGNTDNYPDMMERQVVISGDALQNDTLKLKAGETAQLTATIQPLYTQEGAINWGSADEAVATVANGLVTAQAEGETVVYAIENRQPVYGYGEVIVIVEGQAELPVVDEETGSESQADAD